MSSTRPDRLNTEHPLEGETMAPAINEPTATSVPQLGAALSGRVITPEDAEYDDARRVFSGEFDRRPAAIARVADEADVARVVAFAADTGLELAVRSGGHSGAGHCTTDGGIVLDLRDMEALDVDVEGRTAWAQEVVTADGQLLRVDAERHPDLFWAIRGGGGNFGVATRFRFRLHELDSVVGGMLMLPASAEVVAEFIALAEAAPEELSTIANVMPAPPMPFVPEEHHGKLVVLAFMCYAGEAEAGQRALAPFRALTAPLADMVRPIKYPEMYPPEDESYHPTAVTHTMFIDTVDQGVAETIMKHLEASDASMRVAQLRVLGGAMARVRADATAFAHRASKIMVNVASFYEGPEDRVVRQSWVDDLATALRQDDAGAYVNFLVDEGEARVREAYPGPTWDRLAAIKARYDPTNLFHLNQNIPPLAADGGGR